MAGLACAVQLQTHGVQVTVVERSAQLGADACSWFAGGMLAPWCEGESAEPSVVTLGSQASTWWKRHVRCVHEQGTLVVAHARDTSELRRFANRTQNYRWVNRMVMAQLEPDVSERFNVGLFYEQESHLDPRQALQQLVERIHAQGGEILWGVDGRDIHVGEDMILDCRGFSARDVHPRLRGVRGEMLLLRTHEIHFRRPIRVLHPRIPLYVVPRGQGVFMLGATMIESDKRGGASVRAIVELLNAAYALHPSFAEAEILELGAEVRPAFIDNLPEVRREGATLYVNGLYRHGFLLAPAVAHQVAAAVLNSSFKLELRDAFDRKWRSV